MPRQKRRYNVRFPPKRIKKIMQKDTEVGRIAMAVPVIIARALEMFLKSLLTKTCLITESKFSPVVSVAHMKQCIESEKHFHFLKDLVDQSTSTTKQMDNRGTSMWPLYSNKQHDISSKRTTKAGEMVSQSSPDSFHNSSSSDSELYICL
ncbi:dr1-associated corepressor isoform 3-T3 [Pholidichthys leucotaenia]